MAKVLWGEGKPQFLANAVLYTLPYPSDYDYFFIPDQIIHTTIDGKRTGKWRGFRLAFTLFYDLIEFDDAIKIRDILNYSRDHDDTIFIPHNDYPLSFKVKVNEDSGWNLELFHDTQTHGYGPVQLVVVGTEWRESLEASQKVLMVGSRVVI